MKRVNVYLFIYLFIYLSIYLSIYLFVYLFIYLFIYLFQETYLKREYSERTSKSKTCLDARLKMK